MALYEVAIYEVALKLLAMNESLVLVWIFSFSTDLFTVIHNYMLICFFSSIFIYIL